jgi:hypothetical protein
MVKTYFYIGMVDKNGNVPAPRTTFNQKSGAGSSIEILKDKIKLNLSHFDKEKELDFNEIIEAQTGSYPLEINLMKVSYISFKFKDNDKIMSYTFIDKRDKCEEIVKELKKTISIKTIDNSEIVSSYNKNFWKIAIIAFVIIILFLIYEIFIFLPSLTS